MLCFAWANVVLRRKAIERACVSMKELADGAVAPYVSKVREQNFQSRLGIGSASV